MSITSLTRSAVYGQNGMVSSDSPLAASVGLRVLQDGGTAFDAALAVAAVECVTIVPMCGLGGDSFILAYDANSDTVTNINSSGAAAAGAEAEYYRQQGLALMPIARPPLGFRPRRSGCLGGAAPDIRHADLRRTAGPGHQIRRERFSGAAAHRPGVCQQRRTAGPFQRHCRYLSQQRPTTP